MSPFQFLSVVEAELLTPMANGFIRNDDASVGQKIFDIAKAQTETMIKPDGMPNDFRREAMTMVARATGFHAASLAVTNSS